MDIDAEELGLLDHFFAKRTLKTAHSEAEALFLSRLMHISRQGHLCWKTSDAPPLPSSVVQEGEGLAPQTPVVRQGNRYYLQRNWVYETHILDQVKRLLSLQPPLSHNSAKFSQDLHSAELLPMQKKAIDVAFHRSFSLICGGPGTGKTYTAAFLARLLSASSIKQNYKIVLAAPTGKAASHLQAVIGVSVEATTLHRLLRIQPGEIRLFSPRKIDADLVIVDEASMIDVPLLAQLLESIGSGTRLVLMGDPDQLPPVEAGSLFAEMAELLGTRLTESKRTENVELQQLAQQIHRGEWPLDTPFRLPWAFDATLESKLFELAKPLLSWEEPDPLVSLQQLDRFRILGALRQGPFGIDFFNRKIVQEMERRILPGQWWGVPIMVTSNAPNQNLYNGTCGILIGKSRGGLHFREGTAYFPQAVRFPRLPSFEPTFCLSIHKSQGSEFDHVLALFPPGSEHFGREAIYTAVTRAKKGVEVVGEEGVLRQMLLRTSRRDSGFTERFN